ncbi:DUF7601 domain-containing protein [Pediococcus inopinatus]|uniref:DUF7601 domain-containing protein n=1 Tax=Pediococcus inopinatus TaxID=114090 RepID=UPI00070F4ED1|nr:collagen-binding domain-containing protein [Pediococcus inopinatus]AVL00776.1 hypothetical protein PI20285_09050 [Pediococcus inopinatus]KRN61756.1 hypothetical protein IV83_GL000549 [Pediococcus inopinatus]
MTMRKVYSVLMICLLLFGIGYPATGAFAEEDKDDQFKITETELTNENGEKLEEVDADKQANAKFHLKMTGKQARENDSTVLQLLGSDSLKIASSAQQITPEVVNGTFVKAPTMTFQYESSLNSYMLKWNEADFENIEDDQVFDYEVTLPLEVQTITEDSKANMEMKFSGLTETIKFGSLSFLAPVENEKVESEESTATDKESETSSKANTESSENNESEDDADADADTESIAGKAAKAIENIDLPTLPDRTGNPLGVAANFHIFAENFVAGGHAHTSGNIAVNSLTNTSGIGNEKRDEHWQETSYVKNYDGSKNEISFRTGVFGNSHSLVPDENDSGTCLTGGPLGTSLIRYHTSDGSESSNPTGAAINENWIDVTSTLSQLDATRDDLVRTPYAIDFNDTRYLTTNDDNRVVLNFENELIQNTFVIKVNNSQIAGKELDIKLRNDQNVIFIASPNSEGTLGAAHMKITVDGDDVGADPESGGNEFKYSILWVIPEEFKDITLVGSRFFGSILAPTQKVTSTTDFNGTIVADTYTGSSAETHSWTYNPTKPVDPEPETTQLVVQKTVDGSDEDKNKDFKFVITRLDDETFTGSLKIRINGSSEEVDLNFKDGKSEEISLKHGEHVSLTVPNGSKFSINETQAHGAETSIDIAGEEGLISGTQTGQIEMGTEETGKSHIVNYTNKFDEEEPETKDLKIKKTVTGNVPSGTKFKFNLSIDPKEAGSYKYSIDGGTEQTIEFDEEGNSTSSIELEADQTATIKELPENAKVTITEIDADGYKTTVKHDENDAEDKKEITIDFENISASSTSVVFNNHLTEPTMPVTGGIGNFIVILVGFILVALGGFLFNKNRRGSLNG